MNPATKTAVVSAAIGAGYWGARQLGWTPKRDGTLAEPKLSDYTITIDPDGSIEAALKETGAALLRTSLCATAAGWFQVYSGGIVIDTVATRLQAGKSLGQSLWGLSRPTTNVDSAVARLQRLTMLRYGHTPSALGTYWGVLKRSNLMAGHFVTMLSRFPYLFLNFTTYQQTEKLLMKLREANSSDAAHAAPAAGTDHPLHHKSVQEEVACVLVSTVVSTTVITAAECPKIIDQVGGQCGQRSTVMSILRTQGARRLMQGYTACFCREFMFNTALLMSPGLATALRARLLADDVPAWLASAVDGKEIVVASLMLGLPMGMLTNGPDQLKTNIQTGRFKNMREAWAWQRQFGGGIRGLYGPAAFYRGLFIAHAVVAFNFARDRVERYLEQSRFAF